MLKNISDMNMFVFFKCLGCVRWNNFIRCILHNYSTLFNPENDITTLNSA